MQPPTIPTLEFNSPLTKLIFELEHQREKKISGTTPAWLFFDLKDIMQRLESLTSARIEGNRTTLLSVVEDVIEGEKPTTEEALLELRNIDAAIKFIEENIGEAPINRAFICELHKLTTNGLKREGSKTPGDYRSVDVTIANAEHAPPPHTLVPSLMQQLIDFINEPADPQLHLLKVAVTHHHMAAIHPFDNGNGRTVRLVTYAMLAKYGFIDKHGFRLLNPSAIFCIDRQKYYDMLAAADTGTQHGLLTWCEFVLSGMKVEIDKIDKLLNRSFAEANLIMPALDLALEKKQISDIEFQVMRIGMKKNIFQAKDIEHLIPASSSRAVHVSRLLGRMKEQKLIMVHPNYKLKYVIRFANNYLLRGVVQQMAVHDLLPVMLDES